MVAAMETNLMDVDNNRTYLEDLYSEQEEKCGPAVLQIKCALIGSNKQKNAVVEQGVARRLIQLMQEARVSAELQINIAYTLGSIAKGMDSHLKSLIAAGIVPVLLNRLTDPDPRLIEGCLACLKTVFQHPDAPIDLLYGDGAAFVPHLINLMSFSASNMVSVSTILTHACKKREHQEALAAHGLIPALHVILCSPHASVQLPALKCLALLVIGNEEVAAKVVACGQGGQGGGLLAQIVSLMDRYRKDEIQLNAAKCVTYLYRCNVLEDTDGIIIYKALPCSVRMTKKEESIEMRILAAETLSYLIETSASLQRVAAISNHLIPSMAAFLKYDKASSKVDSHRTTKVEEMHVKNAREMKRAAFRVFASLGANDEEIRKRVIETDNLMPSLVEALEDEDHPKLQMAAIGCLHSLSRSVQLLRTTFQDHPVWKPLMKMLSRDSSPVEPLIVASSTLCNLLLEFSPSKEPILDSGAVEMLCSLTHKYEPSLRLNGVWGLMNMAFQAEQRIKVQIINSLDSDQIFHLLSDSDLNVVMKTLGLLRNLLSNKHHIDHIMASNGKQIMQAVVLILESENVPEVKEQALCILANIADGDSAKVFIMSNEDVLKKITNYMVYNNSKLQIAAVFCVQNLTWSDDEGSAERQARLREMGVYKILQQLLTTTDTALFDKVKGALQQFT